MSTTPTSSPLLSARHARVDREGSPLCEDLCLQADGERVVIAGPGANALIAAIMMVATISKGEVRIDGFDVGKREHLQRVGLAPLDPPLPSRMNVEGFLNLHFRTAGLGSKATREAVKSSLSETGLGSLQARRTESLQIHERRAILIASAMLPGCNTLVVQSPLIGLEGPASHYVLTVLGHASQHRKVLASTSRFDAASPEHSLIMGATHVLYTDHHATLWSGTPATLMKSSTLLSVRIREPADAFLDALAQAGFEVHGTPPTIAVSIPDASSTRELLTIADQTNTALIEMVPLSTKPPRESPATPLPQEPTP